MAAVPLFTTGPLDPDGTPQVSAEATSLFVDDFSGSLATNWVTGGTAPSVTNGQVTFASSTTASAVSTMRTALGFPLRMGSYIRAVFHTRLETAAVANTTRFWGLGVLQGSPTADLPLVNGIVFEARRSDGALYAVAYSAGVRTELGALTRPTDGAWHRYEIWFRQSRIYLQVDSATPVSAPFANLAVAAGLNLVSGQVNYTTGPSTAPTLQVSAAGVADHSGTVHTIGDGTTPATQMAVKAASTAPAATDPAAVFTLSPNGNTVQTRWAAPSATDNGLTPFRNTAVTSAVVVKASAGRIRRIRVFNPNTSVAYIQILNTASGPALGTNVIEEFVIPASSTYAENIDIPTVNSTGISVGASTTAGGTTAVTTGVHAQIWYA